jgi:2'-5' RNA ligase
LNERVRCFVAILLDDALRGAIGAELDRLRPLASSVAWVPSQNLHLTLKFLGDIPASTVEGVKEALVEAASAVEPFTMGFHGLGAFPGVARPRVVWVGVLQGARECQALQSRVEEALARRGFPKEGRPYTPHLTIGRIRAPRGLAALQQAIVRDGSKEFGALAVGSVSLMKSDLHPSGARYTELQTVSFSRH